MSQGLQGQETHSQVPVGPLAVLSFEMMSCLSFETISVSSSQKHPHGQHEGDPTVLHCFAQGYCWKPQGIVLEALTRGSPLPANMDEKAIEADG